MSVSRMTPFVASCSIAALALVGCGSSSTQDTGPLADVSVSGDQGKAPSVTLEPKPLKVTKATKRELTPGKGKALTKADTATVNFQIINGTDGKVLADSWKQGQSVPLDLGDKQMLPIITQQLAGSKAGSRVLLADTTKGVFGDQGNTQMGLKPTDPVLFVIDVEKISTALKTAEGTAVPPKPRLPTVKMNGEKPATITMPKTTPPTKLVNQPLIQGKGAKVTKGQTVKIAYTGALWRDGKVFDSNPGFSTAIGVGQVVPGWDKSIVGQPVGSRLLLVIPPADGYGKQGQGPIKGTDTMVFVVDILGAS